MIVKEIIDISIEVGVCLRVLKDKRSATLLVALHDYLSLDPDLCEETRVAGRCHVRRALPGYGGVSGEFLLTAPLLIHGCVYESYCSFFFPAQKHPSRLACVWAGVHVCVCVCVDIFMNVCECTGLLVSLGAKTALLLKYKHSSSAEPRGELHRCRCFSRCWGPGESTPACRHACMCAYAHADVCK